eukprot:scaffold33_cov135-Pinguiococcus_pyrenoidosus.AAC.8
MALSGSTSTMWALSLLSVPNSKLSQSYSLCSSSKMAVVDSTRSRNAFLGTGRSSGATSAAAQSVKRLPQLSQPSGRASQQSYADRDAFQYAYPVGSDPSKKLQRISPSLGESLPKSTAPNCSEVRVLGLAWAAIFVGGAELERLQIRAPCCAIDFVAHRLAFQAAEAARRAAVLRHVLPTWVSFQDDMETGADDGTFRAL